MSQRWLRFGFGALAVAWFLFSLLMLVLNIMGDCLQDQDLCQSAKSSAVGLVFWRWLAGCFILNYAYRLFSKDDDVF